MSVLDDARAVLEAAGQPLHYREITQRMLAGGWETRGRTPWETVNARLAVDIKQRRQASRFVRTSPGTFALNPDPIGELPTADAPTASEGNGTLTFADAAERVLRDSGSRAPLHYEVITELALDRGLLQTEGLTPAATMYSVILSEIRRRDSRGEPQRFVQHGRGMVGLAAWLPIGLAARIEDHNAAVRLSLLERVKLFSPAAFEELVGELLSEMGFEDVEVTRVSGDGGIDVRAILVVGDVIRIRMAVQAKRWEGNVQAPVVQQVRGSLGTHDQGLIITTSDFSRGARGEARRSEAMPLR